jgi:SMC interacting uncharacterized protein involved in chromosome segregation
MGDFLQNFQNSLDRLAGLKKTLEDKSATNTALNTKLMESLARIKGQIAAINGQIAGLKAMVDNLQGQVNGNAANIQVKDDEIRRLTDAAANLEREKGEVAAQLAEAQRKLGDDAAEAQNQINQREGALRELTKTKDDEIGVLKIQIADTQQNLAAVTKQLDDRKDLEENQRVALEAQAAAFQKRLDDQLAASQAAEAKSALDLQANVDQINKLEQEVQASRDEMQKKTDEAAKLTADLEKQAIDNAALLKAAQDQIIALTARNEDLVNRIVAATGAINDAVDALEAVNLGGEFNEATIDAEIGLIEKAIKSIMDLLQGRGVPGAGPGAPGAGPGAAGPGAAGPGAAGPGAGPPKPPRAGISDNTQLTVQGVTKSLGDWRAALSAKGRQNNPNGKYTKYDDALNALTNAKTQTEAETVIDRYVKNGKIWGGKKTKKRHRRSQKGGFTYKLKSRRKSITSSTRSNSNRTSKTSRK